MIAKTLPGLETMLASELINLGAKDVEKGRRMVSFSGDKRMLYKANFCLRTAIKILKPIYTFQASDADEIYDILKKFDWDKYMDVGTSFAVDAVVYSEEFRHTKFVAYRVKDAIADYFREKCDRRPNVQVTDPDIQFHIHISDRDCTLCLDSSGESLHRRGYRQEAVEAPISEVLAAGLILMTGWKGECDFFDPMCGSGTFLIEAALIARNIAPGVFRKEFAFERWADFDQKLFDEIYNDDSEEREFSHHIYGSDIDWKAVNIARANVAAAGMSKIISVEHADFAEFVQPEATAIMITNPPYGERITTEDLFETYRMIGNKLKNSFQGCEAWVISYKEELFNKIGLKPSAIVPLFNGQLPCEYRKYELFNGRYADFRESGDSLDRSQQPTAERRNLSFRQEQAERRARERQEGSDRSSFYTERRVERAFDRAEHREPRREQDESYNYYFETGEEKRAYRTSRDRHQEFMKMERDKQRKAEREQREQEQRSDDSRPGQERKPFHGDRPFRKEGGFRGRRDDDGRGEGFRRDGERRDGYRKDGYRKEGGFHKGNGFHKDDGFHKGNGFHKDGGSRKNFGGKPSDGRKPSFRKDNNRHGNNE